MCRYRLAAATFGRRNACGRQSGGDAAYLKSHSQGEYIFDMAGRMRFTAPGALLSEIAECRALTRQRPAPAYS